MTSLTFHCSLELFRCDFVLEIDARLPKNITREKLGHFIEKCLVFWLLLQFGHRIEVTEAYVVDLVKAQRPVTVFIDKAEKSLNLCVHFSRAERVKEADEAFKVQEARLRIQLFADFFENFLDHYRVLEPKLRQSLRQQNFYINTCTSNLYISEVKRIALLYLTATKLRCLGVFVQRD